jgi:hypothetical protein
MLRKQLTLAFETVLELGLPSRTLLRKHEV